MVKDPDARRILELERARYAVELHAYYGEPAVRISDEDVVAWLDLLDEYHRRTSLSGNGIKVRVVNPNSLRRSNPALVG